ncbi:MAG: hypothetical protein HYX52_09535 [Chloroflexi bacterium]|nr:hypothetical protein [Chloroflexota bacterium]
MTRLIGASAYLMLHFVVYVLLLRNQALFGRERPIFLWHALSFLAVGLVVAVGAIGSLETLLAVMSLHGLYSLTFLELWSLSEGGYSISIVRHVDGGGSEPDMAALEHIGGAKHHARLNSLSRLGLLKVRQETVYLTSLGGVVARACQALRWVANIRGGG